MTRALLLLSAALVATPLARATYTAGIDPLSILDARSPGARTVGELVKAPRDCAVRNCCPARHAFLASQRTLAGASGGAAVSPLVAGFPGVAFEDVTPGIMAAPLVGTAGVEPAPFAGGGFVAGPIGGVIVPPGMVAPPAVTPPDAPAAVPEPATWAMLLVGFGMLGAGLRMRKGVLA